jgi:high-affinity nickel-transport protein
MTLDMSLAGALGVGFVLGLRHATDADHIAAVSTLITRDRNLTGSCLLGAWWGLGHTVALSAVGLVAIGFRLTFSPDLARGLERVVAVMLVVLGGQILFSSLRSMLVHVPAHDDSGAQDRSVHARPQGLVYLHGHHLPIGGRPFAIGLVHGLAGSATLTLLALSTIPTPLGGMVYILVFGAGSTAGMLVLSGVMAVPMALASRRSGALAVPLRLLSGVVSLLLGLWLLWDPAGASR